ncbi:fibronectin type III domain-containing protein, partial [Shewanella intestini]
MQLGKLVNFYFSNSYRAVFRACLHSLCCLLSFSVINLASAETIFDYDGTYEFTDKNGSASSYDLIWYQEKLNGGSWSKEAFPKYIGHKWLRSDQGTGIYEYQFDYCREFYDPRLGEANFKCNHSPIPSTKKYYVIRKPSSFSSLASVDLDGSIYINWQAVNGATSYELQKRKGGGDWTTVYSGVSNGKTLSSLDTGQYQFRVRTKLESYGGEYLNSSAVTVVRTANSITVPSNDADGAYTVSWAAVSGATGYQLEQKVGSGAWASIYTGTAPSKAVSG